MKDVRIDLSSTLLFVDFVGNYDVFNEYQQIYNKPQHKINFIHDSQEIPVFSHNNIDKINCHPAPLVVVDLLTESLNIIHELHLLNPTKFYILVANGKWDVGMHQFPFKYALVTKYFFLHTWAKQLTLPNNINFYVDTTYKLESDKYLFCAIIGAPKPIRDSLVAKLLEKVDSAYSLTYNGKQIKGERVYEINYDFDKFDSYEAFESKSFYNISASIPVNLFNSCKFNLVVETNMHVLGEFHLTEKTMKAIVTGIPFVIAATHHFVKNLKLLGFKTFNELWSEEYDNIEDMDKRTDAVVQLINELEDFDWVANREKLEQIAAHNRLHLTYGCNKIMKDSLLQLETVFYEHC